MFFAAEFIQKNKGLQSIRREKQDYEHIGLTKVQKNRGFLQRFVDAICFLCNKERLLQDEYELLSSLNNWKFDESSKLMSYLDPIFK